MVMLTILILPLFAGLPGQKVWVTHRKFPILAEHPERLSPPLDQNQKSRARHPRLSPRSLPGQHRPATPDTICQTAEIHDPRTETSDNHPQEEMHMESVNSKDRHGHTPLITAAKEGQKDFVLDLLNRGADVTATSVKGKTVLHYAAANGHTEIVKVLIEKGAIVDTRDRDGHTPIMLAAIYGCNKTIQVLLDGGASPSIKTLAGTTAAQYAENNNHPLAAALLKKAERAKHGNA
jgi:ankyrin repeat protein